MIKIFASALITVMTGMYQSGISPDVIADMSCTFTTYDSNSKTTHVTPTHIYIAGTECTDYTYDASSGNVTMDVPYAGTFTLKITADSYTDFQSTYKYSSLNGASINLVKIQEETQSSSTLTWIHSKVSDLDSHMYIWNGTEKVGHVYYRTTTVEDANTKVTTTKDDTGSGSGETTTIDPVCNSYTYQFWVYRYSGSGSMMESEATVVVTKDNVSQNVTVPKGDEHRWWHVYDVNNGSVTIVNTVQDTEPSF